MGQAAPRPAYAGLRARSLAFSLDYLIICGYILALVTAGALLRRSPLRARSDALFATPNRRDLVAFLTLVLPVLLYFAWGESSAQAATWGKRRLGLQVVDAAGGRLSRGRALARAALKLLPCQVAHTSLFHIPGWPTAADHVPLPSQIGLGLVWVLVGTYGAGLLASKQHRTLYDRLTGSIVIRRP